MATHVCTTHLHVDTSGLDTGKGHCVHFGTSRTPAGQLVYLLLPTPMASHSCIIKQVPYLHQALEDGQCTAACCWLLASKAFNQVDVTIALQMLTSLGVWSKVLPWVISLLSNRRQSRVHADGALLDWLDAWSGVPQGIRLCPVVFCALVNHVATLRLGGGAVLD